MQIDRHTFAALAALAVAAAAAACDEGTSPDALADCLAAAGVSGPAVGILGFAFHPDTVRVAPGGSVTWVNCEDHTDPHTTTADEGAWDSGFLYPGDEFTRTFDQAGELSYHCVPHPTMRGVVVVESPA